MQDTGHDAELAAEEKRRIEQLRRRMQLWVAIIALVGVAACAAILAYGKYRNIHREHYDFRQQVRQGMSEHEVAARFGDPYRTYWTKRAIEPVLAGRGVYSFSEETPGTGIIPDEFKKVMHYRPTLSHGEFVFVGEDGKVLLVLTGRRKDK